VHYHLRFDLRLEEPACRFLGEERLEFEVQQAGEQDVTLNCRELNLREAFVSQPHLHGAEPRRATIEPHPSTESVTLRLSGSWQGFLLIN
jgi:aminopeptidase N